MSLSGVLAEIYVFAVLVAALVLFLWGRWRYDIVALLALLAIGLAGILPRQQLFLGFGHPAIVTVAAILIVSRGLADAGVVNLIGSWLARAGDNLFIRVMLLTFLVAVASAFMNNVGALALLMPVAIRMARNSDQPPSRFLMPLAFGSLLGGLITLIGTPPNIIIATMRAEILGEPFRMFDFTPVGGLVAALGVIFIIIFGRWLVPQRQVAKAGNLFQIEDYLTELRVPAESPAVGRTIQEVVEKVEGEVLVVSLVRQEQWLPIVAGHEMIMAGDLLVVEANSEGLEVLGEQYRFETAASKGIEEEIRKAGGVDIQEAVVMPESVLADRSPKRVQMRQRFSVNLLAISRQGTSIQQRLADVEIRAGDVLLLEGPAGTVEVAIADMGCLPVVGRELRVGRPRRILFGTGLFLGAVLGAASGVVSVELAFVAAAVLMILTGVMQLRHAYESIDWSVIVLLGAMIPVGEALDVTGGSERVAGLLWRLGSQLPEAGAVALVIIVSMSLSNVINNAAAAVLLAPVAISLARSLEASPDPFLIAVAIGASCAFLTPIGHQSNTLVMGPGGYRFGDYWRLGLPLSILIVILAVPLILYFWPL